MKRIATTILFAAMCSLSIMAQDIVTENGRAYKLHIVEQGEGLYRLSLNNNTTQEEIIAANPELKERGLVVGMKIKIPLKEVATTQPSSAGNTTHVVAKGETSYSISKQYGMSLAEFYQMNPTAQGGLNEGQAVKVKGTATPSGAKTYRLHIIHQGETLYGIGVKYGVKADAIIAANPTLDITSLPIGTIVRIPDTTIPVEDSYFYYHQVTTGETLFSISIKYNILQDKVTAANPDINWQSLQVGQIVAIPKADAIKIVFTTHEVQRRETLYGITRQYEISVEELQAANPEIDVNQLKKGQVIQIPIKTSAAGELPLTTDPVYVGTDYEPENPKYNYYEMGKPTIRVGLMLPFDAANEMARRRGEQNKDFRTGRYLDFYQGVRMAIDTIKASGVNVKLNVFDTSDKMVLANINNMPEDQMDLIIGPAKSDEMHSVAQMAKANKIPMVLPFGQMDSTIKDNPFLFQASIIDTVTAKIVTDKMIDDCTGKNIILLNCSLKNRHDITRYARVKSQCEAKGIELHTLTFNSAEPEKFLEVLSTEQENVLLMPTTAEAQLNSVIVAVASVIDQKKDAKISLYGLGEWLTFQTIEVEVFHKLNTRIYTSFAIDYENASTQKTIGNFRKLFFAEPVAFTPYFQKNKGNSGFSEYALWGYDIATYFVTAAKEYGSNMLRQINDVKAETVQSNFRFENLTNWGGQINTGLKTITFTPANKIVVKNL